jgi:hypothetical protein
MAHRVCRFVMMPDSFAAARNFVHRYRVGADECCCSTQFRVRKNRIHYLLMRTHGHTGTMVWYPTQHKDSRRNKL